MSCTNCEKSTPQVDGDSYEACQTPLGSFYFFNDSDQFECFNPCKLCKRSCDKCDNFGAIETIYCYQCDEEVSNCQVFNCASSNCAIYCVNCADGDAYTGLCSQCLANACDQLTQDLIDSFC